MPKRFLAAIGLCVALATPALAAGDDGFAAFWGSFSAAAAHDDRTALATMMVLGPGLDDNDQPVTFDKIHALYLKAPARRCLAAAKPKPDAGQTYSAFCGQLIYGFSKTGGGWKWTDLSPDD